ncbi:MAG: hypothetical protein PHH14_05305 [Candidatus Margulisbacteria bacterium]|nr:hypothetical protein [Candidatus Margulisiibacteriota bacterium]
MTNQNTCDNYPFWIPSLSILLSLAIYSFGAYLLSVFGLIAVLPYIAFCLWTEYRVLSMSCRYCCYYGKLCGVGKGLVAPLFVKKGDPKIFLEKAIGWKELIPDFLVFLIPVIGGIIYLFIRFNFLTILLIAAIVSLAMPGAGFMRSCLLCPNCKQRELGCSAEKLFGKKK